MYKRWNVIIIVFLIAQFRLVAVLPNFSQNDRRVESEEDAKWQSHSLDHCPRVETEKVQLEFLKVYILFTLDCEIQMFLNVQSQYFKINMKHNVPNCPK